MQLKVMWSACERIIDCEWVKKNISFVSKHYVLADGEVCTWFSVMDVNIQSKNNTKRNQCGDPFNNKHNGQTQQSTKQCHPHGVVFKSRPPPCNNTYIIRGNCVCC